jgi:hypothetical protein
MMNAAKTGRKSREEWLLPRSTYEAGDLSQIRDVSVVAVVTEKGIACRDSRRSSQR